jgi:hypothetical protein
MLRYFARWSKDCAAVKKPYNKKVNMPSVKLDKTSRIPNGEKTALPRLDIKVDAPSFMEMQCEIIGISPLVVHRFSQKAKKLMLDSMITPPKGGARKKRDALDPDAEYNGARYVSEEGWDGFNVSGVRNALISACRLTGIKMTMAKLCIFVHADGRDKDENQYSLIRIHGTPERLDMIGRLKTGAPNPTFRPKYFPWKCNLRIAFDTLMIQEKDILNLLIRVGMQVGFGEGRPDSRESAGMGWGLFKVNMESIKYVQYQSDSL